MHQQSKNQKVDEAAQDPVVYFDPRRILFDIWDEIFQYNTGRDLLRLSLVCKNFYEIIGNSPEAMDKIVLKIDGRSEADDPVERKDETAIFNSSRNYKHIECFGIQNIPGLKVYLKFIEKFEETLRTLEFSFCNFTTEEFSNILDKAQKNLRKLVIGGSTIVENSQNASAIIPRKYELSKLEKLEIISNGIDSIQKFLDFMPDTLLEVIGNFWTNESSLINFLERQKNLENLNLMLLQDTLFFHDINSDNINFKLEKLNIGFVNRTNCKDIDKFLKYHSESLKVLRLENVSVDEFYDSFKNMPKLKSLDLANIGTDTAQYESGPSFNCPSLKTLIFNTEYLNLSYFNFTQRFSNVQKIVLLMDVSSTIIKNIAKSHPSLKVLVLNSFNDNIFIFASFKNLTTLEIPNLHENYNYGNRETEINLENSIHVIENLEVLKLGSDVLVTEKCLLQILTCKKLKHLEILNGSRLSDDILNRYSELLKYVRFVKICNVRKPPIKEEEFESCISQ